jgi:hypothetical protein
MGAGTYERHFLQDKPGSPRAVQRGCSCPAAENNFGRGRFKNGSIRLEFATDPECPVHGIDALCKMLDESDSRDDFRRITGRLVGEQLTATPVPRPKTTVAVGGAVSLF